VASPRNSAPDDPNSPAPPSGPNSFKLFDSRRSILGYQLDIGPLWTRRGSETTALSRRTNFEHKAPLASEIAIGGYYQTPAFKGPFYMTSSQGMSLQIHDDKSFFWTLFLSKIGGGIKVGPFELEGKFGVHMLSADIIHAQASIQLLSPRAEAAAGIHVGPIRVDFSVHSEYLWRWFGPDYYVRGFNIGIRFDQKQPKTPFGNGPYQ